MKFSLNDDNEEDEESHPVSKQSPSKPKKHKFTKGFNDNKEMGDTDETDNYDMFQKVEETPEEHEVTGDYVEPTFVVKEAPRGSQQRKYKAWERTDYKIERDTVDPEQEYTTIAERIRNRNKAKEQEYNDERYSNKEPPPKDSEHEPSFSKNHGDPPEPMTKTSNQMINRLQSLKDQ